MEVCFDDHVYVAIVINVHLLGVKLHEVVCVETVVGGVGRTDRASHATAASGIAFASPRRKWAIAKYKHVSCSRTPSIDTSCVIGVNVANDDA